MLHHVSLEVAPDDVERTIEFFGLLGFQRIPAPDTIAPFVTWLESGTTQVHLIHTPEPTTPMLGHPAVVASDFAGAVGGLREAGFTVWKPTSCGASAAASRLCPAAGGSR